MGDEKQIEKSNIHKSVEFFLSREVVADEEGTHQYSIRDEYRTTRKNISIFFYMIIVGFLAFMGLAAFAVSQYIQIRDAKTDLNLSDFQDLNLKQALAAARDKEKSLELAVEGLARLEKSRDTKLSSIRKRITIERNGILSGAAPLQEKRNEIRELDRKEKAEIASVKESYRAKMARRKKRIAALRIEVKASKSNMKNSVDRADALMYNYKRLHRLQMDRQRGYYENRLKNLMYLYNPRFRSRELLKMLAQTNASELSKPEEIPYSSFLAKKGLLNRMHQKNMTLKRTELFRLMERMHRIPYKNDARRTLFAMRQRIFLLASQENSIRQKMILALKRESSRSHSYRFAMEHLAGTLAESGLIIDPRNKKMIQVQLNRTLAAGLAVRARVFRGDAEFVGIIEFLPDSGGREARLLELMPGKTMKPFDRILVDMK